MASTTPRCDRCDRWYNTAGALQQHITDSPHHFVCWMCSADCESRDELHEHYELVHDWMDYSSSEEDEYSEEYSSSDEDENGDEYSSSDEDASSDECYYGYCSCSICPTCDRHFESEDNLLQHDIVHQPASISCYGCTRKFRSYSAMIIHLESGKCPSGIDVLELNKTAAECYQWKKFVDEDCRISLLEGFRIRREHHDHIRPFRCPMCQRDYPKLSALFQHIDSNSCDQTLTEGAIGKLVRWLENQHDG